MVLQVDEVDLQDSGSLSSFRDPSQACTRCRPVLGSTAHPRPVPGSLEWESFPCLLNPSKGIDHVGLQNETHPRLACGMGLGCSGGDARALRIECLQLGHGQGLSVTPS